MKKLFFFLSAIALLGLTAACVEQAEVNPNFDPASNSVKTAFTINVATQVQTKASDATAQVNGKFRGMDDMKLFVVKDNPSSENAEFMKEYRYDLGTLGVDEITASQSSKFYDITIPTGVNNMVFYAKATDNKEPREGKIYYSVGVKKDETHFDIWPVLGTEYVEGEGVNVNLDGFTDGASTLGDILNVIINTDGWAAFAAEDEDNVLSQIYQNMVGIGDAENTNGSGFAVQGMIQDIYDACQGVINGKYPPMASDESKALAADIVDNILALPFIDVTDNNEVTLKNGLVDFPCNLGLPSGVAQLGYNPNKGFYYLGTEDGTDLMGAGSATLPEKIAYPVELCYWVSSPLRVNEAEVAESDYPSTVTTWAADNWGGTWEKNGTVKASTHSVALQNNIQYGTALLKTSIKFDEATLRDNRKAIMEERKMNEEDMEITLGKDSYFTLSGILVGGQPNKVSWTWAPQGQTDFSYVIYDNFLENGKPVDLPTDTKTTVGPFNTLVFDNLKFGADTKDQEPIYIALELQNHAGVDFWGRDNIVRDGATFYLLAELDVNGQDVDVTKVKYPVNTDGNGLRFPPFNEDGSNKEVIRAFMQDFATDVTVTIGPDALKNAYSTVPDLREVEMCFGLSVDLEWSAGPVFDLKLGVPTNNNDNTGTAGN